MIDIRDLRIGSHVAHKRYPDRVCRIECIMPSSVYLSYIDSGVRVKMFNVPLSDLDPLEITEERLNTARSITGLGLEGFQLTVDWLSLESFVWIEFGQEIIAE